MNEHVHQKIGEMLMNESENKREAVEELIVMCQKASEDEVYRVFKRSLTNYLPNKEGE